jgi:ankyrin repeat protein
MTRPAPLLAVLLAAVVVIEARSITDEELDALLQADNFAAIRGALGDSPEWTTRVLSVFEDQGDLLTMAAMHGAARVTAGLLAAGANVDGEPAIRTGRNVWGFTPLYAAARAGHATIARLLIAAGADTARPDHAGFAPLHVAAAFGRLDAVKVLIDAGVPVDARALRGDTALKLAVTRRRDDIVLYLLSKRADPNLADVRSDTPLHEATRNDASRIVQALFAHGARLLPNRYGRTAIDEARDWAPDLLPVLSGRSPHR